MKKVAIIVVSGLILIVAFAFLIYPTPYKYMEYRSNNGDTMPVKHNIITGETRVFTTQNGWIEIENRKIQGQ